jgi:hypothetical protein
MWGCFTLRILDRRSHRFLGLLRGGVSVFAPPLLFLLTSTFLSLDSS